MVEECAALMAPREAGRHDEIRAADGTVTHRMCCYCFRMVPVVDLWRDADGKQWVTCGADKSACAPPTRHY